MANCDHVKLVMQGTHAIHAWREQNQGVRLDLEAADLRGASLSGAPLEEANLQGANLQELDLRGALLYAADLRQADLREADLREAILLRADLRNANLFEVDLHGADLREALLSNANLTHANIAKAFLFRANLHGAILLGLQGANHALYLETAQLDQTGCHHDSLPNNDTVDFDRCHRQWPERYFDWERLRTMGRLPLLSASYTALILIPIVFYGLALYNDKVEMLRTWAEQVASVPDNPLHRLATLFRARLHPHPIPSQSFILLISTILLAVASTLYTALCPSRIKEFSRDQWCDQLGRSLLHYWPLAWKHRWARFICIACYTLGGLGVLWVIGNKIWNVAGFILKHSAFPWPWR